MSTIIVGDLHGKIDIAKELLQDKEQSIVFVGDYLDSFDLNVSEQIDMLDMILDAVKTRDNVEALLGNHELAYLAPLKWACSGWMHATQAAIMSRKVDMWRLLSVYAVVEGFLITHAGVSKTWLPKNINPSLEAIVEFLNESPMDTLTDVGWSRGGRAQCGGPFWCDWWNEFKGVPGLKQVVGHTRYRHHDARGILEDLDGNFNIDCLDGSKEVLLIHEGTPAIVRL